MAMTAELIEGFEDYFLCNNNLLISLSINDILKVSKYNNILDFGIDDKKEYINQYNIIIEAKLQFVPALEDILVRISLLLRSDEQILAYILSSNVKKINSLETITRNSMKILGIVKDSGNRLMITKSNLKSLLNRCKFCNILFSIIRRFFDLAGIEVSRSFKIYKIKSNQSSAKYNVIGGIIYFLFLLSFETFTPGLKEFLLISLKEFDSLIEFDPSLLFWNPELCIIRSILALCNRSDRYSMDCRLKIFIFHANELKVEFRDILKSSLDIKDFKVENIARKLMEKFGNLEMEIELIKSFQMISNFPPFRREKIFSFNGTDNPINSETFGRHDLFSDFFQHLDYEMKI